MPGRAASRVAAVPAKRGHSDAAQGSRGNTEPDGPDAAAAVATLLDTLAALVAARLHEHRAADELEVLTVADIADITGQSPQTIRRACQAGTITARKLGDEWLCTRRALVASLERGAA